MIAGLILPDNPNPCPEGDVISILIIGNEILSAQVKDLNMGLMLDQLNQRHFTVDEVRIVRDEISLISAAINDLRGRSDFVISSGGVGPTHDDVTLAAYAAAFEVPLISHPDLERRIHAYFGADVKAATLSMALVPENAELVDIGPQSWPVIKVGNCFVLPGLPEVFNKKFAVVLDVLPRAAERFRAEIYTTSDETEFAAALTRFQDAFANVEMGSYPTWRHSEYAALVTMKSTDRESIEAVFGEIERLFQGLGSLVKSVRPAIR